jgi:DNA-binding Lrp family transcriptional regulator
MLSGEIDFILRCVARDLPELQTFITEKLTAARNVASVKTALAIRNSKQEPGIPLENSTSDVNGGRPHKARSEQNGRVRSEHM